MTVRAQEAAWRIIQAHAHGGAGVYVLQRHGGARTHRWRPACVGPFHNVMFAVEQRRQRMRQGALRLVAPDGTILWTATAPRLRSRW